MPPRRAAVVALAAVGLLWLWQAATVHFNYGGNWTALFCIRPGMPVPEFLKSEKLYIFEGTEGYDGQVYHLIAHDPWMRKGSPEAIAGASFRYQRIFVPALAWLIAFGQNRWIHAAYFAVILAFAFLGVYWSARLLNSLWGLAFVLLPATIVSIDRMTADIALAALTAGFALFAAKEARWKVLIVLTCAALTRETALPIIAGYALYLISRKRLADGFWTAATALPAAAWYVYLNHHAEPSPLASYVDLIPFAGFFERWIHPASYTMTPWKSALAISLDYVALAGIALALVLVLRLAWERRWDAHTSAAYALAIAAMLIGSRSVWEDAYAFGRVLTPLLLIVALIYARIRPWLAFAPILMVDARIVLNLAGQMVGVVKGLLK